MKYRFTPLLVLRPKKPHLTNFTVILWAVFALTTYLSPWATAATAPGVLYRSAVGAAYKLYIPSTKAIIALAGTEFMSNVVVGDVDGDGLEDEMVYSDASTGRLGYYKMSNDGLWHPERNHLIPNITVASVPLTVVRSGGVGTIGRIIYRVPSTGMSYRVNPDGTGLTYQGRFDRACAVDMRGLGYKSDFVWWRSGSGMGWRAGVSGITYYSPEKDAILLGAGKMLSGYPTKKIVYYSPSNYCVYACDTSWSKTQIAGTYWSWCTKAGSTVVGDADNDGLNEMVIVVSATTPLKWYNVPPSGTPWTASAVITEPNIVCGWNLCGVASIDLMATPAPTPTPVSVSSIGNLKTYADGTLVQLNAKPRTKLVRELSSGKAMTTGYYLEETDKTAGIRVVGSTSTVEGQVITATGTLGTVNGERAITATNQAASTSNMKISPTVTTVSALFGTVAMTGLLVQATGTLSSANTATGTFNLTDGTKVVKTYCPNNSFTSGKYVVTGCVGAEKDSTGAIIPVLRVESATDMVASATTPTPTPDPTTNVSYSIWTQTGLKQAWKTDAVATLTTPSVTGCRNEHEPFQIVLRGGTTQVSSVTVTKSDLASTTAVIPAANVSVYLTRYIYLPDYKVDYPDALPPYQAPFNLAAGQTQSLWVDVFIPKTAAAGDYTGKITLTDAGGGKAEIPYKVHVYNVTLPDDWKCSTSFAMRGDETSIQHKVTVGSPEGVAIEQNYYDFMLSKGVSDFAVRRYCNYYAADGAAILQNPRVSSFIYPETSKTALDRFRSIGVLNKGYSYTYDEPSQLSMMDGIRSTCNNIHSNASDARTMVAFSDDIRVDGTAAWASGRSYTVGARVNHQEPGPLYTNSYTYECIAAHTSSSTNEPYKGASYKSYWKKITIFDELNGYIDIWCVGGLSWDGFEAQLKQKQAAGDTVWTYNWWGISLNGSPLTEPMDCLMQVWGAYHYGIKGLLWWCADYWHECPDPWTNMKNLPNYSSSYGEGSLYYPGYQVGLNTGVSSIRMEMLQQGLEDYQLLWLAEQKFGRTTALSYADQLISSFKNYSKDPKQYATVRDQLARAVEN